MRAYLRPPTAQAVAEMRAAAAALVDACDSIEDELDATYPDTGKLRRLADRAIVELGSLGRAIAGRAGLS